MCIRDSPSTAFIALTGIYLGAEYGGSISSILINTPGTTAAVITAFDGYQMCIRDRLHAVKHIFGK